MSIFLKKITLSNFRGFGPNHAIEINPTPGVTILSGANGLGKSTVLEAIEWALAGDILRLKYISGGTLALSALHRHDAAQAKDTSYFVNLDFLSEESDVVPFKREARITNGVYGVSAFPSNHTIQKYLITKDWNVPVESLGAYLHLTHLQSQSSSTRFSGLDPKEQWQRLRGPAGLNQLSMAQERLGNTTRAFNEELGKRTKEYDLTKANREKWAELIKKREILRERLIAVAAIPPEKALSEISLLDIKDVNISSPVQGAKYQEIRLFISRLTDHLNNALSLVDREIKALDRSMGLPKKIRELDEQLNSLTLEREATNNALGKKTTDLQNEKDTLGKINKIIEKIELDRAGVQKKSETYQRAEFLLKQISDSDLKIEVLNKDFESISKTYGDAAAELEAQESISRQRKSLVTKLNGLRFNVQDLKKLGERLSNYFTLCDDLKTQAASKNDLQSSINETQERIGLIDGGLRQKINVLNEKNKQIQSLRQNNSTFSNATSVILSHIGTHEGTCPLCLTEFTPELLRNQIEKASSAFNSQLVALERDAASIKVEVDSLHVERNSLFLQLTEKNKLKTKFEIFEQKVNAELAELTGHPLLTGIATDFAGGVVQNALEIAATEEANLLLSIGELPGDTVLTQKMSEIRAQLEHFTGRLAETKNSLEKIRQTKVAATSALGTLTHTINEPLVELNNVIEKTKDSIEAIEKISLALTDNKMLQAQLLKKITDGETECRESHSKLGQIGKNLDSLNQQKQILMQSWKTIDAEHELTEAKLEELLVAKRKNISDLESNISQISHIQKRLLAWEENLELESVNSEIMATLEKTGSNSELVEGNVRELAVIEAERSFKSCESVRDGVDWLKNSLSKATDLYAKEVLEPLNDLQDRFLLALTSGRRWKVRTDAHITSRRTELNMKMSWDTPSEGLNESISANQVLSEGQMAAVTLAQLFAMSSAYQWSQWKGLLLDAPTQHNDLIHATSLIEVLRNLVLVKEYQIILCTHDLEEAEFLKRKLKASSIKVSEVRFLGHGANGVKTETTQYNLVANSL